MRILFSILFFLSGCQTLKSPLEQKELSIWQGQTTASTTIVSLLVPPDRRFSYSVTDVGNKKSVSFYREVFKNKHSQWRVERFTLKGLNPKSSYEFKVTDREGKAVTQRSFSTLNLNKKTTSFAVASCLYDHYQEIQEQIWPELLSFRPDMIFLIGDNVYTTSDIAIKGNPTPREMWERYVETFSRLVLYKNTRLTPIFATWDDNDYGKKDGGRYFKHREESQEMFATFFPRLKSDKHIVHGPGISHYLSAYGQRFIFMDNRSFRSPNNQVSNNETHWGAKQERWLLNTLNAERTPTWIINGDQIFGGYNPFESYERNHPNSFDKMMRKIKFSRSTSVFLTGDRHLFEISKIKPPDFPYETYEITTSAIHATVFPSHWEKQPNPRQLVGVANKYNYVILQSTAEKNTLNFKLSAYTLNREALYKKRFEVKRK